MLERPGPAATFIARGYNLPFDVAAFVKAGEKLLQEVMDEIGWMYETVHTDGKTKGRINFTVWSENFACPECGKEFVFHDRRLTQNPGRFEKCSLVPSAAWNSSKTTFSESWKRRLIRQQARLGSESSSRQF